jgi:hypothetical protein
MSFIRINGNSYEQRHGKYLVNVDTNEYLQYNGTEFVHGVDIPAPAGSIDLLLYRDGKIVRFENPSIVLGGGEQDEDEEDVPVNRAAALIEEALNAKAAGCDCDCGCGPDCQGCACDCDCPKAPVAETPVEETPVEETPVEETPVEETPVAPVAEDDDDVPDLVEDDDT